MFGGRGYGWEFELAVQAKHHIAVIHVIVCRALCPEYFTMNTTIAPVPGTEPDVFSSTSWQSFVTLVIILGMLVAMTKEIAPPDMIMMASLIIFIPLQIITVEEVATILTSPLLTLAKAVQGFCNTGMLTVAALFVVATGVERTGAIEPIRLLLTRLTRVPEGQATSLTRVLMVVMVPVSFLSAFLNNTPVVAMMIPVLDSLGRTLHISPSKLLIPLSYASIFGGTCTLIGTSTNLVVVGLARDAARANGEEFSMGIFDISQIGVPVLLAGYLYIVLFAVRGLPSRLGVTEALDRPREYITVMIVMTKEENGNLAGKSVADAGLRSLPGLFLIRIERLNGDSLLAPSPQTVLSENDKLYFAGVVDSVLSLTQIRGLRLAEESVRFPLLSTVSCAITGRQRGPVQPQRSGYFGGGGGCASLSPVSSIYSPTVLPYPIWGSHCGCASPRHQD